MRTRPLYFVIAAAALTAACTRSFPSSFPRTSAVSVEAEEAPVATVGRALREEPPLPGEPTTGWEALEPADSEPSHGGHTHAH